MSYFVCSQTVNQTYIQLDKNEFIFKGMQILYALDYFLGLNERKFYKLQVEATILTLYRRFHVLASVSVSVVELRSRFRSRP